MVYIFERCYCKTTTIGSMELATSNVGKVSQAVVSYCKRKYIYPELLSLLIKICVVKVDYHVQISANAKNKFRA